MKKQSLTIEQAQTKLNTYAQIIAVGVIEMVLSTLIMFLAMHMHNHTIFFAVTGLYFFALIFTIIYGFRCATILVFLSEQSDSQS